jgi:hypothetical protein
LSLSCLLHSSEFLEMATLGAVWSCNCFSSIPRKQVCLLGSSNWPQLSIGDAVGSTRASQHWPLDKWLMVTASNAFCNRTPTWTHLQTCALSDVVCRHAFLACNKRSLQFHNFLDNSCPAVAEQSQALAIPLKKSSKTAKHEKKGVPARFLSLIVTMLRSCVQPAACLHTRPTVVTFLRQLRCHRPLKSAPGA